jgi:hypothetical protein
MTKIASKLAELRRRVAELESHQDQPRYSTFRGSATGGDRRAVEKRLASLRRSCEILARHLAPRTQDP